MNAVNRREMLKNSGLAAAALAVGGGLVKSLGAQETESAPMAGPGLDLMPGAFDADGKAVLPPLRYAFDALDRAIDAETMEIHHDRHHQGYVNGYNSALDALAAAREAGDFAQVAALSGTLTFNGGGHVLHTLFWDIMGPEGGGEPTGALAEAIARDFGSFEAFRAHFIEAAKTVEGSGWGILALHLGSGRLIIHQARNQNLSSLWASLPIVLVDVWEHAYYLRYRNRRADYVTAFMDVVAWDRANARYERIMGALAPAGTGA